MLKQVYKIDENGYRIETLVANFDVDGNCIDELPDDVVMAPPQGIVRTWETAHWDGEKWVETMTEAEYIATLPEPERVLTEIDELRLEQAQANTEMIELMLSITNGGAE